MSSTSASLFQPIEIGDMKLRHRVVLAPQTRFRCNKDQVPGDLLLKYYKQRASVPGTLLITESTYISAQTLVEYTPGIYSGEQVTAWRKVTDVVHARESYIFLQISATGRMARNGLFSHRDDIPYVAPSPVPLPESPDQIPRELTKEEIKDYVGWYATAASNAVYGSGFDGVEVHAANGYLINQFLNDKSNLRTDEYGGSVENRARFGLEVVDAVVTKIGQKKTAIRLSPWDAGRAGDMRMDDPVPTYTYFVDQLKQKYPDLAYLHVVTGSAPLNIAPQDATVSQNFINRLWAPRPVVTTGGYDRESGLRVAEETGQLIGYSRAFSANPDLPFRLRENIALNEIDHTKHHTKGSPEGYTTYKFSKESLRSRGYTVEG
ncbi:NADH:flavin oxidoreductase/NADH oxidase [Dichomitus squalens]|uniref:NADH:flavin oxidoreductase/NADH oxidase n=1 Tax=Dichomitus squalens TaxID=114155 RepID=A0A4V2K615_9APHY|nr:NADH:flavin oxidoreductase/NADH oxidase [Dichomitus squalens]TBU61238.1 NADH:flavin oxidoreductase/NADH oxidase [Dichomitus squalens]